MTCYQARSGDGYLLALIGVVQRLSGSSPAPCWFGRSHLAGGIGNIEHYLRLSRGQCGPGGFGFCTHFQHDLAGRLDGPAVWFYDGTMTHAVRSHEKGWVLSLFSRPLPANRIRVRVGLAGLCRTDIQAMSGEIDLPEGRVMGHEAAGWIEHIPRELSSEAAARQLAQGDRVAFFPFLPCGRCQNCLALGPIEQCHAPSSLGLDEDGAFAPFVDLPPCVIFKAPSSLSMKHLAYAEPVSAAMAVVDVPVLMHSKRVGVVGSGRIADLTITVLNAYRAIPAEHLDTKDAWPDCRFDAIVETRATSDVLHRSVRALRPGGALIVKSRPSASVPWPHRDIVMRRIQVCGAPYGSFAAGLAAMESGVFDVTPMLGEVFEWSTPGINRALDVEASGKEVGGKLFFEINK